MKKAGFIIAVIVLLLIINGLLHSIYDLWQKQSLVVSAQKELDLQKYKNVKLKEDLSFAQSQQFVDETARNKLFLAKPGEQRVIIPKDEISAKKMTLQKKNIPNWQKWVNLFIE